MKTYRDAFEMVKAHLLSQMEQSKAGGVHGVCLYRGPRGLKCAIGALIDDEHYEGSLEESGAHDDVILDALRGSGYPVHRPRLYEELQAIHDEHEPCTWEGLLHRFEEKWGDYL